MVTGCGECVVQLLNYLIMKYLYSCLCTFWQLIPIRARLIFVIIFYSCFCYLGGIFLNYVY